MATLEAARFRELVEVVPCVTFFCDPVKIASEGNGIDQHPSSHDETHPFWHLKFFALPPLWHHESLLQFWDYTESWG